MNARTDTQVFFVRGLLIEHCGQNLTPDLIDTLVARFQKEIETEEGCGWAFRVNKLEADLEAAKVRLREVAQILIEEIGAEGPMNAEDAAAKAVELIRELRACINAASIQNGKDKFYLEAAKKIIEAAKKIIKDRDEEINYLRAYGNNDCTNMADAALELKRDAEIKEQGDERNKL